jgi:hypothetical protein
MLIMAREKRHRSDSAASARSGLVNAVNGVPAALSPKWFSQVPIHVNLCLQSPQLLHATISSSPSASLASAVEVVLAGVNGGTSC